MPVGSGSHYSEVTSSRDVYPATVRLPDGEEGFESSQRLTSLTHDLSADPARGVVWSPPNRTASEADDYVYCFRPHSQSLGDADRPKHEHKARLDTWSSAARHPKCRQKGRVTSAKQQQQQQHHERSSKKPLVNAHAPAGGGQAAARGAFSGATTETSGGRRDNTHDSSHDESRSGGGGDGGVGARRQTDMSSAMLRSMGEAPPPYTAAATPEYSATSLSETTATTITATGAMTSSSLGMTSQRTAPSAKGHSS